MKISWFLALPLVGVAFTSTLTPACGSGGGLTCQNPTSADQTCITCFNTSCGSDVSAVESECGSSVTCKQACNCGDKACASACGSVDGGSTCLGAGLGLAACISSMCKTQCAGTMF
jgi:hypothetical protein